MAEFGWAYVSGSNLPQGPNKAVQVKKGDEFSGSANFTYDISTNELILSGNMHVSGTLFANEITTNVTTKNVINLSSTGSTFFGDTTDDTHIFTGSILLSSSTHPLHISGLQSGDRKNANSYLALDSSGRIILTSSLTTTETTQIANAGTSDGEIGDPEDGSYADGLFTDFASNTPVGTAIDRFNEVFKILAPSPAPSLKSAKADETNGVTAKLSFDASNAISNHNNVTAIVYNNSGYNSLANASIDNLTAVAQNAIYQPSQTSSEITDALSGLPGNGIHFRLGIYNDEEISGTLNYNVGPSVTNGNLAYASGAIGNAETGSLYMKLNGTTIHSIDLSTITGSGSPGTGSDSYLNSSGSGFINVSTTASSFDGNGQEWYIFKHRTIKFKVSPNDQAKGRNQLIIQHDTTPHEEQATSPDSFYTNYITWVNDPDGAAAALSVSNNRIENVSLVGSKYVSGVQYNTDLTANYKVDISNMYRNVFPSDSNTITFTPTNSNTPSAQSVPDIGGSEDHTKVLGVTASVDYNGTYLLNGTIGMSLNATHPLKSNLSNAGSTTITGMLIDADTSSPNSNLVETFIDEDFRISSGSYDTQGAVDSGTWTSSAHMTASGLAGHEDGMLFYNRRLYYPKDADIPNAGNFSTLANVSSGQPNYSGISGIRTFFRKIQNTSGADIRDLKITSQKTGFKFNTDAQALDTNDSHFLIKIPGKTGWMNITEDFVYGSTSDGDGALINGADNNSNNTGTGNSVHCVTFGTQSIGNNEYALLKIETNGIQGFVSQLSFQLGASAETAATPQVLSDIDANDTGTDVKLSFGSSNGVAGYSNVQGSGVGSMSTIDSNGDYTVSGNRRGAFSSSPTIDGEINDAIAGDGGSDFPAKAFFNAYSGSLVLEVNGSDVHTVDLTSTLSAINTTNGQSSRLSVSAVDFSTTSDDIPDYTKPYRTGTYEVAAGDQRAGWNYARLKHGSNTTNYVEWVVDASGAVDNSAVSTPALSDFGHTSIYYQSGIGYFAARPTGSFTYSGSNFYSNVYSKETDAISFGTTDNCSISNIRAVGSGVTTFDSAVSQASMPALNNSDGCETTTLQVTGTVLFDHTTSISGGLGIFTKHNVSVDSTLKHPFKTNRTTSAASKTAFMVYSGSIGSTTLTNDEYFNTEDFRIVSGNYANQSEASSSTNTWNSQTAMNNGGTHDDGMVSVNGFAISPPQIGVAGNTGHADLQAPAGNPDYSSAGLTNNIRTFYRLFRYTGVGTVASFTMTLYGDATLVGKSGTYAGSLGANKNVFVELKVPFDPNFPGDDDQSTIWADAAKIAESGSPPGGPQGSLPADGAGIRAGSFSGEDQTIDSDGLALSLTLGTRRIKQNQYYIVKISAHKDWTGYISRIQVAY